MAQAASSYYGKLKMPSVRILSYFEREINSGPGCYKSILSYFEAASSYYG